MFQYKRTLQVLTGHPLSIERGWPLAGESPRKIFSVPRGTWIQLSWSLGIHKRETL